MGSIHPLPFLSRVGEGWKPSTKEREFKALIEVLYPLFSLLLPKREMHFLSTTSVVLTKVLLVREIKGIYAYHVYAICRRGLSL